MINDAPCKRPPRKKRKVLAFQNVVCLLGASVECFVKVRVRSTSSSIRDVLMYHLWWQKAPMWFLSLQILRLVRSNRTVLFGADGCYGIVFTIERRHSPRCWTHLPSPLSHHAVNDLPLNLCRSTGVGAVALLIGGFWLNHLEVIPFFRGFISWIDYWSCGTLVDQYWLQIHIIDHCRHQGLKLSSSRRSQERRYPLYILIFPVSTPPSMNPSSLHMFSWFFPTRKTPFSLET